MQVLHLYQCIMNINYKLSPVFKLVCRTVTFLSLLNDHCPWWSTSPRFFPLARVLNLSVPGGLAGIATKCYWIGETMMVHTRIQTWDPWISVRYSTNGATNMNQSDHCNLTDTSINEIVLVINSHSPLLWSICH